VKRNRKRITKSTKKTQIEKGEKIKREESKQKEKKKAK